MNSFATLMHILDMLKDDNVAPELRDDAPYCEFRQSLANALPDMRAVIVINAKNLNHSNAKRKLGIFLEDLLEGARHVRVIVVASVEKIIFRSRSVLAMR